MLNGGHDGDFMYVFLGSCSLLYILLVVVIRVKVNQPIINQTTSACTLVCLCPYVSTVQHIAAVVDNYLLYAIER